jgi:hypothetical protein
MAGRIGRRLLVSFFCLFDNATHIQLDGGDVQWPAAAHRKGHASHSARPRMGIAGTEKERWEGGCADPSSRIGALVLDGCRRVLKCP